MTTSVVLVLFALVYVTQGVVLSWEESLPGKVDYRFLFFDIQPYDSGYTKPYFQIINGLEAQQYATLGALDCPSTTSGVAVYDDFDADGFKTWRCTSINILPFAEVPTEPSPPLCPSTTSSGTPALWNNTIAEWYCAGFNHILTAARRGDETPCATADFMYYDAILDEIRCISPIDIDEVDTALGQKKRDSVERVDPTNDLKWHPIATTLDVTQQGDFGWNQFRWTPSINYDLDSSFSLVPSPPMVFPFQSTIIAVSYATFQIVGYSWKIVPPVTRQAPEVTDQFTGVIKKLSGNDETIVTDTLLFNSVSASSGQTSFGTGTVGGAVAEPGETFVGEIEDLTWETFTSSNDVLAVQITLWIQVTNAAL